MVIEWLKVPEGQFEPVLRPMKKPAIKTANQMITPIVVISSPLGFMQLVARRETRHIRAGWSILLA